MTKWRSLERAVVGLLVSAMVLLPIIWMLMASFKTRIDALSIPPDFFFVPTIDNYAVLATRQFVGPLINTTLVGCCSSALVILLGTPLAFFISRRMLRGASLLFFGLLSTRMAPPVAVALPLYWVFSGVGLIDSYPAIVLTHVVVNLPVGIWLLRVIFDSHPFKIEEPAMVDGHSLVGAFFRVVLPFSRAGIGMVFLVLFLLSWNELLLSSLIVGFDKRPITVAVLGLVRPGGVLWGEVAAISMISLLPAVVIILIWQRRLCHRVTYEHHCSRSFKDFR